MEPGPRPYFRPDESRLIRWFLILAITIAALYLGQQFWRILVTFEDVIILLFLAWLLSFILDPPVNFLVRAHIPKLVAAFLVYIMVAAVFILGGLIFIPILTEQTSSFISALSLTKSEPPHWIITLQSSLQSLGVNIDLNSLVRQQLQSFQNFSVSTLGETVTLATSVLAFLVSSLLVLIFSFYFVIDGGRLWRSILIHTPERYHDELSFIKNAISFSFAGFLRTQVLIGVMMGVITYVVLALFGVNYAVTAATFAGIGMIVPVLGPILSIIPPILVALVNEPENTLIIFVLIFLMQAVIVNVIGPLLFKRSIGIHPVIVLVAFIVGFRLLGGWGAVFAVPVVGVLLLISSQLVRHWAGPHRREIESEQ